MAGNVTRLSVQKNNPERVNVFLDGEYAFSLDIMAASALRKGQWLSEEDIDALGRTDEMKRAYLSAVRLLGVRPRSRREIAVALERRQFSEDAVTAALERLQNEGLLSDAEFARFWTENRSEFRPRSARALQYELRQKGVTRQEVDEALEHFDDDEAAWRALQARPQLWTNREAQEAERRILAFLARRGFDYATARRAWKRLTSETTVPPSEED